MGFLTGLLPQRPTRRQYIAGGILFVSYLLAARLGATLFIAPAVIYPAAGVALAGLVLEGIELWPMIFLAALFNYVLSGSAVGYLLILPATHTLQAVVGALVLKKLNFDPLLRRLRDMFLLMGVAIFVSLIVPTGGLLAVTVNRLLLPGFEATVTWGSWWTGVILSLLVVAPLIIRWGAEPYFTRSYRQIAELVAVFAVLLSLDWAIFWWGIPQVYGISLIYVLLVPFFWLAIRIGPRFTILAMFLTSTIAIAGGLYGPYTAAIDPAQLGVRLFQLEIFINILTVIFYIIAALQEERTEATKSLTSYIDRLEEALNRLSLNDRAKSDFIAVLAHELRNPLAPIVSSLEFLRLEQREPEEEEALDLMDDRLKTVGRLLDDLLDVSRIERSKINLKKEAADLRVMLERSVQSIARQVAKRNQTLSVNMPAESMAIHADPVRIEQIVTNLLTNASKFTDTGGSIALSAVREGDTAIIRVRDTGIGIEPGMLERVFEPFLQLETGTRMGEGLGIGLSLTKRLVEMHEGTIAGWSAGLGQGSEFMVQLPLIPGSPTIEARRPPLMPASQSAKAGRVLVVDDNAPAAHGIGRLLEHKGYVVEYAYSAAQAREKALATSPDTIVLDIGLPDTDGYSLARLLRLKDNYGGQLIALTGYGQEEDKERAIEAGFDYHLTKPVGIADLVALLSN